MTTTHQHRRATARRPTRHPVEAPRAAARQRDFGHGTPRIHAAGDPAASRPATTHHRTADLATAHTAVPGTNAILDMTSATRRRPGHAAGPGRPPVEPDSLDRNPHRARLGAHPHPARQRDSGHAESRPPATDQRDSGHVHHRPDTCTATPHSAAVAGGIARTNAILDMTGRTRPGAYPRAGRQRDSGHAESYLPTADQRDSGHLHHRPTARATTIRRYPATTCPARANAILDMTAEVRP